MGDIINSGGLALAAEFAKMALGILAPITVVSGLALYFEIGGPGVGKFIKGYIQKVAIGSAMCFGYLAISTFMTTTFGGG